MKLKSGKWYKAEDGSKWYVDWAGENRSVGHSESGIAGMWDTEDGESIMAFGPNPDLSAPWTEPRLRPWKREEVPHNSWFRSKSNTTSWVKMDGSDSKFVYFSSGDEMTLEILANTHEHSTDGGTTWHPCGVAESIE